MIVAFRTDASLDIGTGHVMRCLTLADALRERGAACRFICRAHPGNLIDLVRDRGHTVVDLPAASYDLPPASVTASAPAHARWLGTDWATDARQTANALADAPFDWIIVDHYALDARWEHLLRPACQRLMVIDDLADRPHDCDLLLDQNLGRNAGDYASQVPRDCTLLIGPRYALLRPEFAALRAQSLARREKPQFKRLLITMGGVDKDNATGQVLDALKDCALPAGCEITVVMGPHAPWLEKIKAQGHGMPWSTTVLTNVADMARLMTESDLVIGAAGSSSWERCCLALPSMILVLADNQRVIAHALQANGAARLAELSTLRRELSAFIQELTSIEATLTNVRTGAPAITDGLGALRVTAQIMEQRCQ
ncbi:UDP-2,4-diacetamido-2,4,6-trideoxy-beta-L-altropyranose hydrolase [Thiocapsa rosea]|uniref:UDP-2,4-diacetamido-2,4, 6-trideoxy-beta-L-altropyranose hydrolase n=1 Tax=Thiocapsa rosea TaxID=69360 RepID=A0A495V751_9GAMM|nr:UDP-2,4-diacetamido-2,4,6-trideoxy-beta-L-altropyranose hydrolase [Thiocapsa rosea]RKT45232.1 UDP-2,4-diacetamido-2,4,6-trideoxy-beta-L-altropyranose hydrolase [Thiocapsa rosea]